MADNDALPLERIYNLADLSDAGDEVMFSPSSDDLKRLADWIGAEAITNFNAKITLHRQSSTRFVYDAHLTADVVQNCVVTLVQVPSHIDRDFRRELHLVSGSVKLPESDGEVSLASVDDDAPEDIESTRYDLAAPLLEEFVMAIDPYPRAPGVIFEPPVDEAAKPESPFAILKSLNKQD